MKPSRRCAVALFLIVVLTARAQEGNAPLAATKQELRKLEGEQKVKPGAPGPAMPGLEMPAFEGEMENKPTAYQLAKKRELEKERKLQQDSQKNWLVNGVEKLERSDAAKEGPTSDTQSKVPAETATAQRPAANPEYLLDAYDDQKKSETAKLGEAKSRRAPQADPFAPFLQDWLGSSPVRGQFFDAFAGKSNDAAATAVTPTGFGGGSSSKSIGNEIAMERVRPDTTVKPNPYLTESTPPTASRELTVTSGNPPVGYAPTGLPNPITEQALPAGLGQSEEAGQPAKKQPFQAPADEKKYFPQLKKF